MTVLDIAWLIIGLLFSPILLAPWSQQFSLTERLKKMALVAVLYCIAVPTQLALLAISIGVQFRGLAFDDGNTLATFACFVGGSIVGIVLYFAFQARERAAERKVFWNAVSRFSQDPDYLEHLYRIS